MLDDAALDRISLAIMQELNRAGWYAIWSGSNPTDRYPRDIIEDVLREHLAEPAQTAAKGTRAS